MLKTSSAFLLFLNLFAIPLAFATPCCASDDVVNYYSLFQRSTYLENALLPGSWWANPASTGEIERKTTQTVNVTPLGNMLTIASAKFLMPVASRYDIGVGIMGQGINATTSNLQAENSGAHYQSNFSFINPSVQFSGAMKIKPGGSVGLLLDIGAEQLSSGIAGDTALSNFLTMGFGAGVFTPWFWGRVSLGLSAMTTGHFWFQNYWNNDGKLALRLRSSDSLFLGSVEYTLSLLNQRIVSINYSPTNYYQVVKAMVSIRFMGIAGLLLGYSDDLENFYANGQCLHVGLELRQSNVYPYYGGYEIGFGLTQLHRDLLIHRFWVGYDF